MLCQYKDIFGKPNEGSHKTRMLGLAFWDVFLTMLLIIGISYAGNYSAVSVTIVVCLAFIILHRAFCVNTALNKKLFGVV